MDPLAKLIKTQTSSRHRATIIVIPSLIVCILILSSDANRRVALCQPLADDSMDLSGDFLTLGSGGSQSGPGNRKDSTATGAIQSNGGGGGPDLTKVMSKIMSDDVGGEFALTESVINHVSDTLDSFATSEKLADNKNGQTVTYWLSQLPNLNGHAATHSGSEMSKLIASQLDFLYATFWSKFKKLIEQIVDERPNQLGPMQLAFRCEREDLLKQLSELASKSSVYGMIMDTFSTELYTHCLRRKLALLRLHQVHPTSLLRQFVDIYLDRPLTFNLQAAVTKSLDDDLNLRDFLETATKFDLKQSLARHGTLKQATHLLLEKATFSLASVPGDDHGSLGIIERFKDDCQDYSAKLSHIWSNFDGFVSFVSSPMNNLVDFNAKAKLVVPQLSYAAICTQLVQTITSADQ